MIAKIFVSVNLEDRQKVLFQELDKFDISNPHPDLLYISEGEKLGIEQARAIKDFFSFKPYQSVGRAVVIEDLAGITIDSQNALLKVLEEPPAEAVILLGASNTNNLLPTVLSRVQVVLLDDSETKPKDFSSVEKLLNMTIAGRFQQVEKTDDKKNLLEDLIAYYSAEFEKDHLKLDLAKKVLRAEGWQRANVNVRGILEYLMLILPKK